MAYNDDAVLAKLSALNETQESIVTVAQWVMFHRRHADRTAQLWLQRLRDSNSTKRLNMIYLANEVAQQSKARKKDDFLIAFSPVIAEATATAYKGATSDVQNKLRRVVEVWRQRNIFETPIQDAIEQRLGELDKSRGTVKHGGGGLFGRGGPSIPSELSPLVPLQQSVTKVAPGAMAQMATATADYDKQTDPNANIPSPPVHAARLNTLLKTLANAEGAVAESIKARTALVAGLEKLLESNREALAKDKEAHQQLSAKKLMIDGKRREVEDAIMKGFATSASTPNTPGAERSTTPTGSPPKDIKRESESAPPEVEELTPPPFERLTQSPEPKKPEPEAQPQQTSSAHNDEVQALLDSIAVPMHNSNNNPPAQQPSDDLLASLTSFQSYGQPVTNGSSGGESASKKRKISGFNMGADALPEFEAGAPMDGIDADVLESLENDQK